MRLEQIKWIFIIIISLLFPLNTNAQRSNCSSALINTNSDSLVKHMMQLIGKLPVNVNGTDQFIQSRYAFHLGNPLAAAFLAQKCASYGFQVRNMDYSGSGRNVIAEKKGSQFPAKSIMLCAHYDCVGGTNSNFQGADDNASGCAAILEAARVLKDIDFPYTLQLAFWDEEEAGLLGSKSFPSSGGGLPEIITVINLDMIAWDGNNDSLAMFHVTPNLPQSIDFADRMHHILTKHKIPLHSFVKNPGEPNTDHQSFWTKDIPAIGLTEDYDNDLSPHWHRFSDSIENIHIPYFVNMSKLAIMTLCEFAQEGTSSLATEKTLTDFTVFPNPAQKEFCLKDISKIQKIEVYNSFGQLVSQYFCSNENCFAAPQIQGIYLIKVFGLNQQIFQQKLWVK
jgi:hypothetical protein